MAAEWDVVGVTGVVALVIAGLGLVPGGGWWRRVLGSLHVVSTIVHEVGHAAVSVVTGGGVYLVQVDSPHSGATHSWVKSRLSSVARSAAGYAAPPLAGLGIAVLLSQGKAHAVLSLTAVLMVLVLIVSRDLVTIGSVVVVGFAAFAAAYWGSDGLQQWVAYMEAWLLLMCELVGLWVLVRARIRGYRLDLDDAAALARETHIPGVVWILGWYALHGWALWVAVPLLVP